MSDMIDVGGIRASIGLDTGDLENALGKVEAALRRTAGDIKALQQSFAQGSLSAEDFAAQNATLERSFNQLSKAAESLRSSSENSRAALGQSISSAQAWGNVIQQSTEKAKAFAQSMRDADAAFVAGGGVSRNALVDSAMNLRSQGIDAAANARIAAQSSQTADAIDRMAAAMSRAKIEAETSAPMFMRSTEAIAAQGMAMKAGENYVHSYTTKSKEVNGANARMAMGFIQLGYVVDDMRYGFGAVANNISPLVYSFTGSMGLAAGLQIAGVAAYELYVHWDDLMEVMGTGRVLTEAEEMERLAKATEKTVEQEEKLAKFKADQQHRENDRTKRPEAEDKAAKDIEGAIVNADIKKVKEGLLRTLGQQGRLEHLTPDEQAKEQQLIDAEKRHRAAGTLGPDEKFGPLEQHRAAHRDRVDRANRDRVETLMQEAERDPGKLRELIGIVRSAPQNFPPGLLKDLEDMLPENRKQQELWEAQGKANEAQQERRSKELDKQGHALKHLPGIPGGDVGENERAAGAPGKEAEDVARDQAKVLRDEKEARERGRRKKREEQQRVDELTRDAEEDLPGLKQQTENARLREHFGGASALDQVLKALKAKGYSEDDANAIAKNLVGDADKSIGSKVAREQGSGPDDQRHHRNSEVFATSDLAHKVQQAVGGNLTPGEKKNVDQNEQMIKLLAQLVGQGPGFMPERTR